MLLRGAFCKFGNASVVQPPLRLKGERFIEIGARVVIGPNSWLEVLDHDSARGPIISIGDGTSTAGFLTITAADRVVVERDVLIARYVYISDHSHESRSAQMPIKAQGVTNISPVRICEGAWLGQGVVVCPGVTIGRNSVVGANSVVRHDVPDFCVAAGAPAKVVRRITPQ
jgi:acetyltransferase-like isoleucine patch superfamily enzyme